MKAALQRLVGVLAIACFAWVLYPLVVDLEQLKQRVSVARLSLAVGAASVAYASLYLFLVEPWRRLVGIFGTLPSFRHAWWCFGKAQWAKYLPSNVLHLVGRQLLGRQIGVSQTALAVTSVLETASLMGAALLLLAVGARNAPWARAVPFSWQGLLVLVLFGLLFWPRLLALARRLAPTQRLLKDTPTPSSGDNWRALVVAVPQHALFFLLSALIVWAVYAFGWREGLESGVLTALLWVVPAGWFAGTVALGAPAGVGVREAVFLLGLEPLMGSADAAGLALAFRVTTVIGDGIVAWSAWRLGLR